MELFCQEGQPFYCREVKTSMSNREDKYVAVEKFGATLQTKPLNNMNRG